MRWRGRGEIVWLTEVQMGADKIIVREALTLEGIVYPPGWEIPPEVWRRLPKRERNTLLNLGKVERE